MGQTKEKFNKDIIKIKDVAKTCDGIVAQLKNIVRKNSRLISRNVVSTMKVLPPIETDGFKEEDSDKLKKHVRALIQNELERESVVVSG